MSSKLVFKVYGLGCASCNKLFKDLNDAIADLKEKELKDYETEVLKVEDPKEIFKEVLNVPALSINDEIMFEQEKPNKNQLIELLKEYLATEN
ncbi:thioredoxin family protein [Methanococcus voltae]|uniref:Uncharacterized protein (DUF2164 family) n=2 Tax=Methanococcus voltae TaxID=2188 RepID=A0A8J7RFN9_METVO|nr:thioredoxin family protein [Methanococcus voltae]MBP2172052.1 uncharacterized protein (DUF2164 family) [Methanococcus voltae]MBP2200992.1 uncharacterized protein (DUF2164 family) [Methanococcus voltae]MCS3921715.1 uncharacterized protein (DUF2164 family) [Methanococcus voltae PS]